MSRLSHVPLKFGASILKAFPIALVARIDKQVWMPAKALDWLIYKLKTDLISLSLRLDKKFRSTFAQFGINNKKQFTIKIISL